MRKYIFLCLFLALFSGGKVFPFSVSRQDAQKIAEKIWKNECGGTIEGLTFWNKNEAFASLGIGHFIWYSVGQRERFQETFPDLLKFLESEKVSLPAWLKNSQGCPWTSREEFYKDIASPRMKSLRQLLFDTRTLQATFMARRLEQAFPAMIEHLSAAEKEKVTAVFNRLAEKHDGLYALIDYLNFKGSGTSPTETYKGQGWGLVQVLQRLSPSSPHLVFDFVQAAKELLSQRIKNAAPERDEERWKNGWFNRLETYLD